MLLEQIVEISVISEVMFVDYGIFALQRQKAQMPYWIESISGNEAVVWVKPSISPDGSQLRLYYNCATAISTSSGSSVFFF